MPNYEWRIRKVNTYSTYLTRGDVEAPNVASAKRLVTKASKTGHWGKRWRREGDTYLKTNGDRRSVGVPGKESATHVLCFCEKKRNRDISSEPD